LAANEVPARDLRATIMSEKQAARFSFGMPGLGQKDKAAGSSQRGFFSRA
jgi:hypothetical protein